MNRLLLKRRNMPMTTHGMGLAHPAEVIEMGDIQALMQSGFDAPGGAIELEPLLGVQFLGRQAGDQRHGFGAMVAQVPAQQGDLFHARESPPLRRWRAGNAARAVRAGLC